MPKKWQILPKISQKFREQFPEISEVVLQLLYNRGLIEQTQIDEFLNPDYSQDVHDPNLFRNMAKAVERIFKAIAENELIVIHGDYDADGVCAAVILYSTLKELGAKHLDVFLPDRELEGYGVNKDTVELLIASGAKLIITCDCGISNFSEVELAQKNNVDVIITDHHTVPPELPPAFAIIHPKVPKETYPDKGLSGCGVAFKLAQALLASLRAKRSNLKQPENEIASPAARNDKNENASVASLPHNDVAASEKWLLDLVAISSVADMVPLLGESRTLTKYGLIVLNRTKRLGLRQLIEITGLNKNPENILTAENIGFQIAPRINAAGRMQHANTAYQLLIAQDPIEAKELARELDANNKERQKITEKMTNQAREIIEQEKQKDAPILFAIKEGWPLGLVGLVASRLCDKFYRPVLVMTKKGDAIHGSGRSIDEINIIAKLEKLKTYFEKFGGHPQACGFTIKDAEQLENFKKDLTALVAKDARAKDLTPILSIDAEINLEEINWELYDSLGKFEPFGENNPMPKYLAKDITVARVEALGANCQHLKLLVKHNNGLTHKMIGFGFGDEERVGTNWCEALKIGDKIDVVFEISVNQWNGNRELQLKIVDLKKTGGSNVIF
ncbi:MAG: single-stranded-DNA-specific exonuclease RecJ [Candidatus Magasanikbacteria bacterium]|nr:single-stranded-DNA-specific exonuclease RecJ [Candidatus Magasanikbacteria bacterium]